jgi:hypothetical protein
VRQCSSEGTHLSELHGVAAQNIVCLLANCYDTEWFEKSAKGFKLSLCAHKLIVVSKVRVKLVAGASSSCSDVDSDVIYIQFSDSILHRLLEPNLPHTTLRFRKFSCSRYKYNLPSDIRNCYSIVTIILACWQRTSVVPLVKLL